MTKLKFGYTRIEGEKDSPYRVYTLKGWASTQLVTITPEFFKRENGSWLWGPTTINKVGTRDYDASVAQVNAVENGIDKNYDFWKRAASNRYSFVKAGCPVLMGNGRPFPNWFNDEQALYNEYSPMTWK